MSANIVLDLMLEAKGRATASMMNFVEGQEWWSTLKPAEQRAFRDRFYASSAILTDFLRDVIKVSGQDERNEQVVRLLGQINASQTKLMERLDRRDD